MARAMHRKDTEIFRVVVTTVYQGQTIIQAFGAYHSLSAARGVATREIRVATHRWRPADSVHVIIERTPVQWENVETIP